MAFETPIHLQTRHLHHHWHLIDPTMTGLTANALFDMDGMVKVNVVGQVMDA
jgi:putative heme degradation protein